MYQLTKQDIVYVDYPIQLFSISSIGEERIGITDIVSGLLSSCALELHYLYRSLFPGPEIDLSSIQSYFEIKNETSLIEKLSEIAISEDISEDMLEFDIVIRMPPKKEWSVRLRVESIEKAKPHIVEPEGF
jgi:hypothetical protein